MGLVVDTLSKIAKSKAGTKFYKWAASEKGQKWLYRELPTLETVAATSCYVYATEKQDLTRREKNVLQWQNVIPAGVGIVVGSYLNKKVLNFGDEIIRHLDEKVVKDVHKIQGAIRVATPILTTALLMRFALPVATAFVSGEIEERRSQKEAGKKLDKVA